MVIVVVVSVLLLIHVRSVETDTSGLNFLVVVVIIVGVLWDWHFKVEQLFRLGFDSFVENLSGVRREVHIRFEPTDDVAKKVVLLVGRFRSEVEIDWNYQRWHIDSDGLSRLLARDHVGLIEHFSSIVIRRITVTGTVELLSKVLIREAGSRNSGQETDQ